MDPQRAFAISRDPWLPRASGDGPKLLASSTPGKWAAPRERGWILYGTQIHTLSQRLQTVLAPICRLNP